MSRDAEQAKTKTGDDNFQDHDNFHQMKKQKEKQDTALQSAMWSSQAAHGWINE